MRINYRLAYNWFFKKKFLTLIKRNCIFLHTLLSKTNYHSLFTLSRKGVGGGRGQDKKSQEVKEYRLHITLTGKFNKKEEV